MKFAIRTAGEAREDDYTWQSAPASISKDDPEWNRRILELESLGGERKCLLVCKSEGLFYIYLCGFDTEISDYRGRAVGATLVVAEVEELLAREIALQFLENYPSLAGLVNKSITRNTKRKFPAEGSDEASSEHENCEDSNVNQGDLDLSDKEGHDVSPVKAETTEIISKEGIGDREADESVEEQKLVSPEDNKSWSIDEAVLRDFIEGLNSSRGVTTSDVAFPSPLSMNFDDADDLDIQGESDENRIRLCKDIRKYNFTEGNGIKLLVASIPTQKGYERAQLEADRFLWADGGKDDLVEIRKKKILLRRPNQRSYHRILPIVVAQTYRAYAKKDSSSSFWTFERGGRFQACRGFLQESYYSSPESHWGSS